MFLYDITSSYFEGNACALAASAITVTIRRGNKLSSLLADNNGCPISVEVFKETPVIKHCADRIDSMRKIRN